MEQHFRWYQSWQYSLSYDCSGTSGDAADTSAIVSVETEVTLSSSEVHAWLDSDHNMGEDLTNAEMVQLVQAPGPTLGESSDDDPEGPKQLFE